MSKEKSPRDYKRILKWIGYVFLVIFLMVVLLQGAILLETRLGWTFIGIGKYEVPNKNPNATEPIFYRPAKTLWNLLEVLIIPVFVAVAIWYLDRQDNQRKEKIADNERKQRTILAQNERMQAVLTDFIEKVSDLILVYEQSNPRNRKHVRNIIHARVIDAAKELDENRKAQVFEFLHTLGRLTPLKSGPRLHNVLANEEDHQSSENDYNFQIPQKPDGNYQRFPDSILDRVDFSKIRLKDIRSEPIDISGVRMQDAVVENADFSNCILRGVRFDRAQFDNIQLIDSILDFSYWQQSKIKKSKFTNAKLNEVDFTEAEFIETNLQSAKVKGIKGEKTKWIQIILKDAVLEGGRFTDATFKETVFDNAKITKIDMERADLRGCSMTDAIFSGTKLKGAKLQGADLRRAEFIRCTLHGAEIDEDTNFGDRNSSKWFIIWQLVNEVAPPDLQIRNVSEDLSDADMSGVVLDGHDFSGCFMQGTNLNDAKLVGAILENTDLSSLTFSLQRNEDDDLVLQADDSEGFGLEGLEERSTNLDGADLSEASLGGADFSGTSMKHVKLHGSKIDDETKFEPKWKLVWQIVNNQLDGSEIAYKDLSNANLANASLNGTDCTQTNFNGADLYSVSFRDAELFGARFIGAVLDGVDFTGAFGIDRQNVERQSKSCKGVTWPDGSKSR